MDLVVLEEIKQLKYRYLRTLDLKRWDEFEATFVPEATGDYGEGLRFRSREEIVAFMRDSLGPQMITLHQCHHPEISVDGDRATGRWYLEDKVLMPEHRLILEGAAFYEDRYVRNVDGWRIEHTGYQRTYEMTTSMDDQPGLTLKVGQAYNGWPHASARSLLALTSSLKSGVFPDVALSGLDQLVEVRRLPGRGLVGEPLHLVGVLPGRLLDLRVVALRGLLLELSGHVPEALLDAVRVVEVLLHIAHLTERHLDQVAAGVGGRQPVAGRVTAGQWYDGQGDPRGEVAEPVLHHLANLSRHQTRRAAAFSVQNPAELSHSLWTRPRGSGNSAGHVKRRLA